MKNYTQPPEPDVIFNSTMGFHMGFHGVLRIFSTEKTRDSWHLNGVAGTVLSISEISSMTRFK